MNLSGSAATLSVRDTAAIVGTPYAVWTYQVTGLHPEVSSSTSASTSAAPASASLPSTRIAIELSRFISIQNPQAFPQVGTLPFAGIDAPATGDVQFLYRDIAASSNDPLLFIFIATSEQDTFSPARLLKRPAAETPWTSLAFRTSPNGDVALQHIITAPRSGAANTGPIIHAVPLENSSRSVLKATHVPLTVPDLTGLTARTKFSFIRQLNLQPGEVDQAIRDISNTGSVSNVGPDLSAFGDLIRKFEQTTVPSFFSVASALHSVPEELLQSLGLAVARLRSHLVDHLSVGSADAVAPAVHTVLQTARSQLQEANAAIQWLTVTSTLLPAPIGMLNLERIEMVPAGIERGGLIATIPLAPAEKTAVIQKEWSVRTKEFTSIVTDSLENYSETGVTDNTELAQSTTSQIQHGNQFNITGTVSGGIPLITGSSQSAFSMQDSTSQSAADSRKHASTVTQKASSRTKQEHKVTISTSTVTGTSETTTRELVNPSMTDPIRIDYFSLMRKWSVRLYRYGLRSTYDIAVPEPAGRLRKAYADLATLKAQIGPFDFPVKHSDVMTASHQEIQHLADVYGTAVPLPPVSIPPFNWYSKIAQGADDPGWRFFQVEFDVPSNSEVSGVFVNGLIGNLAQASRQFTIVGYGDPNISNHHGDVNEDLGSFLKGATGHQVITFRIIFVDIADVRFKVSYQPTSQADSQWRNDVWNALYGAAQTQYYSNQQDIAAKIAALETQLGNVDTLTLRREESDEIMRLALRFLLGTDFQYMGTVDAAVKRADPSSDWDAQHGVAFTKNKVDISALELYEVELYENGDPSFGYPGLVKFINQAIEWENVVSFLYSYFWDLPESWDFIQHIQHPDATRQAFLRAGSARVVLTVRKGWEEAWLRFVDGLPIGQTSPRLTIAQEIAAYDDRNYPGIPPANSASNAVRLQDAVYTTSSTQLPITGQSLPADHVEITVEASAWFVVGARVRIDAGVHRDAADTFGWWEETTVSAIRDAQHITLRSVKYGHGLDGAAYVVLQPGEKGVLIADWTEYTPTSGTDIAVTSNLATIA